MQRKICVVINSRANYGRIKSVMEAIQEHPDLELKTIVGASALLHRFGQAVDVIRKDGFEPAAKVYSIVEGENPTTMASRRVWLLWTSRPSLKTCVRTWC